MPIDRFRLLNEFQRDFPLCARPFAEIARRLDGDGNAEHGESEVIATLAAMQRNGEVSRVGAVFAPLAAGSSTLAAVAAASDDIERVAACISAHPEVNHNYQREHARLNLWFVVTATNASQLAATIARIERDCGCPVLQMPLLQEFHIDLGFNLDAGAATGKTPIAPMSATSAALSPAENRVLGALQGGLELLPQPYAHLALRCGLNEDTLREILERWLAQGFIKRLGIVVRHHELGYRANAMCVWNVPDAEVGALGRRLASEPAVTLCYARARALPEWPYNLYCMIHGRHREAVEAELQAMRIRHGLDVHPHAVLFSSRRFKQCGARYRHDAPAAAAAGS